MALPASGPISSSQVATEFSVSQTNISLSNLGTQLATPISAGSEVELATDFYGQSGVTLTSFGMQDPTEPAGSAASACSEGGTGGTGYHDGSGTYPVANDNVYSDSSGTTALSDGFYRIDSGQSINVESGTSSNPTNCGR
jgi:hypothetical protein